MTIINNFNTLTVEERDEYLDTVSSLPGSYNLPKQTCLRCGNHFPGGLNRCTACGLAVEQAYSEPGAATPWRGYDRGVIECTSCGFETPDRKARKNQILRCRQCNKTIYIPSGLFSPVLHGNGYAKSRLRIFNPLHELFDIIGAVVSKITRKKIRWSLVFLAFLAVGAVLLGANVYRQQTVKVVEAEPPIKTYYNQVVAIRSKIGNALTEFQNDSGGMPMQSEYDDRRTPAKRTRLILACNRVLGVIETSIGQIRDITEVPVGGENYQTKVLNMLYTQQKFYAQMKDSIEQNGGKTDKEWRALWDSAFKMKEEVRVASKDEIEAMTNLQSIAIRSASNEAK